MKRIITYFACTFCLVLAGFAQNTRKNDIKELEQPKLVVGLVIDQMRWDYLTRYADHYGKGGFRRLMRDGYNCNRTLINYIPAITAVGHTCVYTGSVPGLTGIVGNSFYLGDEYVYCTTDNGVKSLGAIGDDGKEDAEASAGRQSPHNMLVTTITDQLRLATNFRGKVIGVALKDRAAILPAGHAANAAYWMDSKSTNFISSTYYMDELPKWVRHFNNQRLGDKYAQNLAWKNPAIKDGPWRLLYDESTYVQSAKKNPGWEDALSETIKQSPWGQTITFDMARAAIEGENLGHNPNGVPDFLTISISSTDMVGHQMSPNSIWVEDLYLRLDKDIEAFLQYLDSKVGKGKYLLFLTADHAGFHNTKFMQDHHLPADTWLSSVLPIELNDYLKATFPGRFTANPVKRIRSMQVHFSNEVKRSAEYADVVDSTCAFLAARDQIAYAFPLTDHLPDLLPEPIRTMTVNGYCPGRSGEVQIIFQSGVMEDYASLDEVRKPDHIRKGTTHSVWSPEDTHIPLVFYGFGVPHGWDNRTHHITDIAATVAALLNIQQPDACVGEAIDFR